MKKTLIFTDFHGHNWTQFGLNTETNLSKRLQDQINVLEQILKIIKERKIERVIVGGDLTHKTGEVPIEVLNILKNFFNKLKSANTEIILNNGNHDMINRINPKWFEISTNIFLDNNSKINLETEKIKLIPFNEEVDYNKIKGYDLVLLHKTPIGSKVGNYTFNEGVDWKILSQNNKLVLFEHIHERQKLSDNCFVLGAPMHLAFGEIGNRGVYILENGNLEFIKLNYPEFITVNKVDDIYDREFNFNDGNYYRILDIDNKLENSNIVSVVKPKYFEERLKGNNFQEILSEWLKINNKDNSYLQLIQPLIDEKFQTIKKIFKGKIKEVKIKYFMSIENITYSIKNGFIFIKGENGSGKSSLFDAIYWCFYNKTTKKLTGDDIIQRNKEDTVVEIVLEGVKGGEGLIKRSCKNGLEIFKNINDKKSVTEGLQKDDRQKLFIESLLGIPENLFLSACYFSQENLKMLTELGDSDKTSLITSLLGFEQYDNLYEKVFQKQKDINSEIDKLNIDIQIIEKNISNLDGKIETNNDIFTNYQVENKELKEKINEILKLQKEYEEKINEKYVNINFYNKEIEKIQKNKNLIKESLLKNKQVIQEKNYNDEIQELKIQISKLNGEKNTLQGNKQELEEQIENIKTLKIGIRCSVCGALISQENINIHIKEINEKLNKTLNKKNKIDQVIIELNKKLEKIMPENFKLIEEKEILENQLEELDKQEQLFQKNQEEQKIKEENKLQIQKNIELCQENIKNIDDQIEDNLHKSQEILFEINKLTLNKKLKQKEIDTLKENIGNLLQNKEKLEFWKTAFSYVGIKALLLDKFCNEFNKIVNKYITLVSNGEMAITLSPTKTIKTGEERNQLGLNINFKGIDCKYESLSGGEKRKVDISLCLALNKWISIKYNIPNGLLGIIILDELFSYIDEIGEESIASLLCEESENKAVFVISHTSSLESYAQTIWKVIKENEISKLIEE